MTNKFHRMAALLFAAVLVWSVFAPAAFAADADECPDGGEHIWMDDDISSAGMERFCSGGLCRRR